jgi:hypothetical protein
LQFVFARGGGHKSRQSGRLQFQIFEIEHTLSEPAEKAGHAIFENPSARAQQRGTGQ